MNLFSLVVISIWIRIYNICDSFKHTHHFVVFCKNQSSLSCFAILGKLSRNEIKLKNQRKCRVVSAFRISFSNRQCSQWQKQRISRTVFSGQKQLSPVFFSYNNFVWRKNKCACGRLIKSFVKGDVLKQKWLENLACGRTHSRRLTGYDDR